ncbi:hypothetical protein [Dethiothermospora halolimnae]|uniref:hypothetical protein n=1 Tax=Dethiothermospora halolimnae TaxID=3114390 RepID=UPI003CCBA331
MCSTMAKKMDTISGLIRFEIYNTSNINNKQDYFSEDITPDININEIPNFFKIQVSNRNNSKANIK